MKVVCYIDNQYSSLGEKIEIHVWDKEIPRKDDEISHPSLPFTCQVYRVKNTYVREEDDIDFGTPEECGIEFVELRLRKLMYDDIGD
jgi:hypothetical protein|tara:strand:+ start:4908 stop:5168 length:261 start_codon:yes stop_codon:yes gene_type:complete